MKELVQYIQKEIEEIESDPRWSYKDATVQTNAPLALIQVGMKSRHQALTEILNQVNAISTKPLLSKERLKEIFTDTSHDLHNTNDNAVAGLLILQKYKSWVLCYAEHEKIFGPPIEEILEAGLTEEDATMLVKIGWGIELDEDDEREYFRCFI